MVETLRENLQIRFANLVVHIRKRLEAVIVTVGAASNKYRVQGLRTWTWLCFPHFGNLLNRKKVCFPAIMRCWVQVYLEERQKCLSGIARNIHRVVRCWCLLQRKHHNYFCLGGLSVSRSNGFDWPLQMLLNGWMHSWRADVNSKCGTHTLGYVVKTAVQRCK